MQIEAAERFARRRQKINELRKQHTREYYRELGEAKAKGVRVAWSIAGLAPSMLDALGISFCSPENYAAARRSKLDIVK